MELSRENGTTFFSWNKVSNRIKWSIYVSTEISTTAQQSRTGNENFWKWNDKFRSDRANRSTRTASGGGPLWAENFHLGRTVPFTFGPKLRENFDLTESTYSFTYAVQLLCYANEMNILPAFLCRYLFRTIDSHECLRENIIMIQRLFTHVKIRPTLFLGAKIIFQVLLFHWKTADRMRFMKTEGSQAVRMTLWTI